MGNLDLKFSYIVPQIPSINEMKTNISLYRNLFSISKTKKISHKSWFYSFKQYKCMWNEISFTVINKAQHIGKIAYKDDSEEITNRKHISKPK